MRRQAARNDRRPQILIFVGTGGVGKTSVAATTALRAALNGRRSLVLTTDPARRLRTVLRIDSEKGQHPVEIEEAPGAGEMWAAMVDVRETLDRAVRLHARPDQATTVLEHPIYQVLISSVVGMQELIAIERLDQAIQEGFDTIVVDTAPSRHALEFLDKPEFLADLVSLPIVRLVGRTYHVWRRFPLSRLSAKSFELYSRIESIVGSQLVSQILDFFAVFRTIAEGYADRARKTSRLLRDPRVSQFCVVTSPDKADRDARYFWEELRRRRFPMSTLVVNRVWPALAPTGTAVDDPVARKALGWYREISAVHSRACDAVFGEFADRLPNLIRIPELPRDVDGLSALRQMARHLDLGI